MRSTLILLVLFAALAGTYFFFVSGGNSSFDPAETEFAVRDTAAIYKVTLEKKVKGENQGSLTLERKKGYWMVNGRFTALHSKVNNFLETLYSIHVKDAMKGKTQESALRVLKENHTVVTIMDVKGNVMRRYLVGATNNQQTANILLLDGADNAYMVSRPGMEGYVSIQYSVNPMNWREKLLFNMPGEELSSVALSYVDARRSFSLSRPAPGKPWELKNKEGLPIADFKPARAGEYMALFVGRVYAADFAEVAEEGDSRLFDSLNTAPTIARLDLRTFSGATTSLRLYMKDDRGKNYFGLVDDQRDVFIVQPFVIDKFLVPVEFFRR